MLVRELRQQGIMNIKKGCVCMWHLSLEQKQRFTLVNQLHIPNDWDSIYAYYKKDGINIEQHLQHELNQIKSALAKILPTELLPYLENGLLNRRELPAEARHQLLQWQANEISTFEEALGSTIAQLEAIKTQIDPELYHVLSDSLHDAIIKDIVSTKNRTQLIINTEGGFTPKALVILTFHNVTQQSGEWQLHQWILYEEIQAPSQNLAMRFILDQPEAEVTIVAEHITAQSFYRPLAYHEMIANDVLPDVKVEAFIDALNRDFTYTIILHHLILPIEQFTMEGSQIAILQDGEIVLQHDGIYMINNEGSTKLTHDTITFLESIYTTAYEDPYAIFSEPMPAEELEEALASDDLERHVRAWNTLYAAPHEHTDLINKALIALAQNQHHENNVMLDVYVTYFDTLGLITDQTKALLAPYL